MEGDYIRNVSDSCRETHNTPKSLSGVEVQDSRWWFLGKQLGKQRPGEEVAGFSIQLQGIFTTQAKVRVEIGTPVNRNPSEYIQSVGIQCLGSQNLRGKTTCQQAGGYLGDECFGASPFILHKAPGDVDDMYRGFHSLSIG